MHSTSTVLDHGKGISLDHANPPFNNYQAFSSSYGGLRILADSVRRLECDYVKAAPWVGKGYMELLGSPPDLVPCAFNWFAITLVNYLRLIALVELMNANGWKSDALSDKANREAITTHCREYVRTAVPEIYLWRNKVAAHFAATDPFQDDNLGTLEQSIMNPVSYIYPYYFVGFMKWHTAGEQSQLPTWSLTKTYEDLRERFWPDQTLLTIPAQET